MTRKFVAKTYFLIDGKELAIDDFCGPFVDEYYIEGWIDFSIGPTRLLGREQFDLVDQVWAYLIDGTTELHQGRPSWETYFPDNPLKLTLRLVEANKLVVVLGDKTSKVDFDVFRQAISNGGSQFFGRMNQLVPTASDVWNGYIEKLNSLANTK